MVLACLAFVSPAYGANTQASWASRSIALVTARGIFPGPAATFQPTAPLSRGALVDALQQLGETTTSPADAGAEVSIAQLDASIVDALGLRSAARDFYLGARQAGLRPPGRFGTEVVARLLGLRTDLPVADDSLELQPGEPATRADAAFSLARVLALGAEPGPAPVALDATPIAAADAGGGVQYVKSIAAGFSLPQLDSWQLQVLGTAVSFIGYPYVWGGDDERTQKGFDCSGLVWRVFKLASYPGAPTLPGTLQGRSASDMAFEVPKRERIGLADIQPADVLFFGDGPHSKPGEIGHAAIYLGNGWLIDSSGQGVALAQLSWFGQSFAWARRPLAEAGLEPSAAPPPSVGAPTTAGAASPA